ncbi:cytochrome P450 [Basidiobolus meristosporus CBS 931.73]|uniref:Cytochrome P450 n=1 Tax=Basidiobolus meristosporus CBS 931.73 TaxID=1314790 RepID=A0A1Y1Y8Q4_9FUNG|nr:cytochrome P450 [Basidiobolus meristosporus CBS 931.73]|eukprot:ORX94392.1 cytochrome P450 [Basidiobolus meristosporus CBS 931.73]
MHPWLLTTVAIVAIPALLIYRWIRVPSHLLDVPGISVWAVISCLFAKKGFSTALREKLQPILAKHKMAKVFSGAIWIVILSDPDDCKKVLLKTETFPKYEQFGTSSGFLFDFFGRNILNTNGQEWKKHRMVANPAFRKPWSTKLFGECVYDLFSAIDKNIDRVQDSHDLMQRLTLDALGQGLFGYCFNALKDNNGHRAKLYHNMMKALFDPYRAFFPFLLKLPLEKNDRYARYVREFNELLLSILGEKKKEYQEKQTNGTFDERSTDLLSLMIKSTYEDQLLTNEELRSDLLVFFIAGHDTTANSLASTLIYLAMVPECQAKARREAFSVLGDDPGTFPTSEQQAHELPYINAVIKEAMRLIPPVANLGTRESTKPAEFQGKMFPAGSYFGPDVYAIQRDPRYWNNPTEFNPERFLQEEKVAPYSWLPFSGGSRQCVGLNFSMIEQRVTLSMLLRKYQWYLPKDSVHADGDFKICATGLLAPEKAELRFEKLNS